MQAGGVDAPNVGQLGTPQALGLDDNARVLRRQGQCGPLAPYARHVSWTDNLIVFGVLVLLSPLINRMSMKMRRRLVQRRSPEGFEAHLRVIKGSVPYVPSVGVSGIAAIEGGKLSFVEMRVRGLVVEGDDGEARRIRGRGLWSLYPLDIIMPIRLSGGVTAELALMRADEARVRSALGLAGQGA